MRLRPEAQWQGGSNALHKNSFMGDYGTHVHGSILKIFIKTRLRYLLWLQERYMVRVEEKALPRDQADRCGKYKNYGTTQKTLPGRKTGLRSRTNLHTETNIHPWSATATKDNHERPPMELFSPEIFETSLTLPWVERLWMQTMLQVMENFCKVMWDEEDESLQLSPTSG